MFLFYEAGTVAVLVAKWLLIFVTYHIYLVTPKHNIDNSASPEHLFIELMIAHTKVLLGVYYIPSLTVDYSDLLRSCPAPVC